MKIGYFCNGTNWRQEPYTDIINNMRDIATYCDQHNWDSIWYTEFPKQKNGSWTPFHDKPGLGLELDHYAVSKYSV